MSENYVDLLITKVREEKSDVEAKLQIAIDALKYIASRGHFIGVPKWDAEFVDAAKEALKKLGVT